jgi:hypothetical protein
VQTLLEIELIKKYSNKIIKKQNNKQTNNEQLRKISQNTAIMTEN